MRVSAKSLLMEEGMLEGRSKKAETRFGGGGGRGKNSPRFRMYIYRSIGLLLASVAI